MDEGTRLSWKGPRPVGVEIRVENLTKRFGRQTIWEGVSLTLPAGEISVLLGPSGTGKSVFLKTLIGLLKPETGSIIIDGKDITKIKEKELYEVRKLFGVLFQDGALFGSQNLFDNIAFPLREHTRKTEKEIKDIVLDKMDVVGLSGAEKKLPGEISGGMRKRAGLARALVLDPQILLFDEPDSGLDPVRTAYLNQLIVDLNAQIEATFLIVTHDINTARTVPDNIGLLYRRHLAMFGPREMLLSSNEPVVRQFLNAQREGPIGMAEEKDAGELESEKGIELGSLPPIPVQLATSTGQVRSTERPPGSWLRDNGVVPPAGSFAGLDLTFHESKAGTSVLEKSPTGHEAAPADRDRPLGGVPLENGDAPRRVVPVVAPDAPDAADERISRARAAAEQRSTPSPTRATPAPRKTTAQPAAGKPAPAPVAKATAKPTAKPTAEPTAKKTPAARRTQD